VSNGLAFTGQGGNKITLSLSQSGSYLIQAQETSLFGCIGPWGDQNIVIHPKPTANEILGDSFVCYPNLGPVPYRINGLPGSQFNWQLTGGTWVQNPGTTASGTVQWQLGQTGRLEVQEISQFGCPGDPVVRNVFVDNPSVECQVVSVNAPPGNDASIWVSMALLNAPYNQTGLFVQRRLAGIGSFQTIAQVAANTTDYQDISASPDAFAYDYRVATINACGDTLYSQIQTSVLLTGDKVGALSASLSFTPYLGWTAGVERYELYRSLDGSPNYVLYDQFAAPTQANYDNGQDGYSHKYRIKAYELGGSHISWSNDLELNFEPLLFIPNAFTPDANGRNDQFVPVSGGLKTYRMRIYSRWGEKLWEGEDPLQGWDGSYKGQAQPEGVYVWVVDYSDFRGRTYQTKGTLHLLR
jgi:gliding motility-associated-like protein